MNQDTVNAALEIIADACRVNHKDVLEALMQTSVLSEVDAEKLRVTHRLDDMTDRGQFTQPPGLYNRYLVRKLRGEQDPRAVYFVLRIDTDGKDGIWTQMCRTAVADLARKLAARGHLVELARDMLIKVGQIEGDWTRKNPVKGSNESQTS